MYPFIYLQPYVTQSTERSLYLAGLYLVFVGLVRVTKALSLIFGPLEKLINTICLLLNTRGESEMYLKSRANSRTHKKIICHYFHTKYLIGE
jgi:hypothetical protein